MFDSMFAKFVLYTFAGPLIFTGRGMQVTGKAIVNAGEAVEGKGISVAHSCAEKIMKAEFGEFQKAARLSDEEFKDLLDAALGKPTEEFKASGKAACESLDEEFKAASGKAASESLDEESERSLQDLARRTQEAVNAAVKLRLQMLSSAAQPA